jgi:ribosomal protein L44E
MSIEAMKQMVEALEIAAEGGGVDFYAYAKEGRQAIAEASQNGLYREGYRNGYGFGEAAGKRQAIVETEEKEAEKYVIDIECTKCGAQQSGILTVHIKSQSKEDHV